MKKKKNKGKIHPSSPSPSLGASPVTGGLVRAFSALRDLPIPKDVSDHARDLSLEDLEVLAYMINHIIEVSTAAAAVPSTPSGGNKKVFRRLGGGGGAHSPPLFYCDCFDCYTAYWLRWDSSSRREVIHQVIEALEDHLDLAERLARGGKPRRDKPVHPDPTRPKTPIHVQEEVDDDLVVVEISKEIEAEQAMEAEKDVIIEAAAAGRRIDEQKGLVRKLLPNVVGLLSSRLLRLWNPSL
ncbi:hypothetical protein SAY86_026357 [Trapa natans]|uniref:Uncharacterized protein n=1 Tax=Trapa natans TaxID=22666 RepID=A0AAN7KFN5_TRANT|nr:hypothetical protein SAY86_026357 [Trapa natans]